MMHKTAATLQFGEQAIDRRIVGINACQFQPIPAAIVLDLAMPEMDALAAALLRISEHAGKLSDLDAREADIIEDLPPETFTVLDQLMPAGPRPARRTPPP
jgi:hypothetical protein